MDSESNQIIMIVGSGLLARAFTPAFSNCEAVCIYAAGVSNSNCTDALEFARERKRLEDELRQSKHVDAFVYFGTCSVLDPDVKKTPYVQHKLMMERLVSSHPRNLVLRLPQVAGKTPNPHTLLNYLYSRISRSESFDLWNGAKRNIIDVADVAAITHQLIAKNSLRNTTLNIANITNYSMADIVDAMEHAIGKRAVFQVVERGSEYLIDISGMVPVLNKAGVEFGNNYLKNVIDKLFKS
jgi:nucleoside-diphosphate-sugar epimerase